MVRAIRFERYRDQVWGGWIGKSLGGTIGHFEGTRRVTHLTLEDLLPQQVMANDDLDIQLVWLEVLLEKGIHLTSDDLMATWLRDYDFNYGEYGYARRNALRGIRPPVSGIYANDYYKTGMGCPIRSEIWAMICPGDPVLAAEYARRDGILDHAGESVWAEQFLAAMEAEAFFEEDLERLLDVGMAFLPAESHVRRCVQDARSLHARGYPWEQTWRELHHRHSHPDCTYAPFNLGLIAMALLYGEGDLQMTLTITANSGWDVDCTCATCAAILGIQKGRSGIDERWVQYVGDQVATMARLRIPMPSLAIVTEHTCRAGVTVADAYGQATRIVDEPAGLDRVPAQRDTSPLELEVDYRGLPVIAYGQVKQIELRLHNRTEQPQDGQLSLILPAGWSSDCATAPVMIPPGEAIAQQIHLSVSTEVRHLADANLLGVEVDSAQGVLLRQSFGVCGAVPCRVRGPFYDDYEQWLDPASLPAERFLQSATERVMLPMIGEEWGNYRVDIDKPYIAEAFERPEIITSTFADAPLVHCASDAYLVHEAYGLQGPCCAYWLQEFVSPSAYEVEIVMGSTDPYKLWLNGTLLATQRDHRFWFCDNDIAVASLHKGVNTLVLKIARTGATNHTTLVFKHKPSLPGYDSAPFLTDLVWLVPCC